MDWTQKAVIELIIEESKSSNIDVEFLLTMANIESKFNPSAKNRMSGAAGLYQFMPSTARHYNLADPYNPKAAIMAVIRLARDNAAILSRNGIPIDGGNLYLAHQQGAGGTKILYRSAISGKPLDSKTRRNINANGGQHLTAKEFIDFWRKKYIARLLETRKICQELGVTIPSSTD